MVSPAACGAVVSSAEVGVTVGGGGVGVGAGSGGGGGGGGGGNRGEEMIFNGSSSSSVAGGVSNGSGNGGSAGGSLSGSSPSPPLAVSSGLLCGLSEVEESWRGSSIAALRRRAIEHTANIGSCYR